jgi:hypothetical protein
MYCSNSGEFCSIDAPVVQEELEDIFLAHGVRSHHVRRAFVRVSPHALARTQVDVFIGAHQHSYERLWPVVRGKVLAEHYNYPKAPFQVVSGSGGCPLVGGFCFDPTFGPRGTPPPPPQASVHPVDECHFRCLVSVSLVVSGHSWV